MFAVADPGSVGESGRVSIPCIGFQLAITISDARVVERERGMEDRHGFQGMPGATSVCTREEELLVLHELVVVGVGEGLGGTVKGD